jgi:hypothetical protein
MCSSSNKSRLLLLGISERPSCAATFVSLRYHSATGVPIDRIVGATVICEEFARKSRLHPRVTVQQNG